MAAYAALVSLMNTMEQIQNHPDHSISLEKYPIESLGEKVGFFLDFIESNNSHGGSKDSEDLESQIASAAHAAEDVIESHIMNQILGGSTKRSLRCLLDLQKIIVDMDSIKEKVMKIKEERGFTDQQPTYSMPAASSRPLTTEKATMVGFDGYLIQLMDVLTGQQSSRQIISIVGMGGIGKTTLAKNAYENLVIVQHFHARAWATISQGYSVREILLELLSSQGKSTSGTVDELGDSCQGKSTSGTVDDLGDSCQGKSTSGTVDELGEQLYKSLSGRKYLIILDDMWSTVAWEQIKNFFPDNGNRSRVVITTRLSNLAIPCGFSFFEMNFLDEDQSWNLFCEKVFGQEGCPPELEKIGKEIAKQCKGLPLSIVVIGGLLRKSYRTIEYWHYVAKNINSILNSGANEQCLNVLSLSYSQLPAHLKPCFLYMGTFPENCEIDVSQIIQLWIAEGFLKPNGAQILEEIAEVYIKDLIDRNLILIGRRRSNGKIRSCRIHDLLRDLCLRVAEKEKFCCVLRALGIPQGIDRERRLIFDDFMSRHCNYEFFHALPSTAPLVSSLICRGVELFLEFGLLRDLNMAQDCSLEAIFQNVNLRYCLLNQTRRVSKFVLPSSISLIWNLQTLIIRGVREVIVAPVEVWKMPQLRHVEFDAIYLPDPPSSYRQDDFIVLGNLQTLLNVVNVRLSEEVCKRIPNIKKLNIMNSDRLEGYNGGLDYCLYINLGRLPKLESLHIKFRSRSVDQFGLLKKNLMFPSSLKKLSLTNCHLHWEDLTMIGSLPQLEVLKLGKDSVVRSTRLKFLLLRRGSVVGNEWSPVNGEFLGLKFLRIDYCHLISWTADTSHFPVLKKLVLRRLWLLNEIPRGVGEIPTLELIRLEWCSESAAISAMKIKKEQESLGNDGLQIQVKISPIYSETFRERVEMEGLTINDIQLEEGW